MRISASAANKRDRRANQWKWLRRIAVVRLQAWRRWLTDDSSDDSVLILCLLAPLLDQRAELQTASDAWQLLRDNSALHDDALKLVEFLLGYASPLLTRKPAGMEDLDFVLHAQYTREEIAALVGKRTWAMTSGNREGVMHAPKHKLDVFMVTLNKTETDYSPSTLYEDYAIDARRFHWQSQSTISAGSPTGQRYIQHQAQGYRAVAVRARRPQALRFGTIVYLPRAGSLRKPYRQSADQLHLLYKRTHAGAYSAHGTALAFGVIRRVVMGMPCPVFTRQLAQSGAATTLDFLQTLADLS